MKSISRLCLRLILCLSVASTSVIAHAAPPASNSGAAVPQSGLKTALTKVLKLATGGSDSPGVINSTLNASYTYNLQTKQLVLEKSNGDITVQANDKATADHLIQHEINGHLAALNQSGHGQKLMLTHRKTTVKQNPDSKSSKSIIEKCTFDVIPRENGK